MESKIRLQREYITLDKVLEYLKGCEYESSIEYDSWDVRTDENNQMEKCIIIKKNAMHGLKAYFGSENELLLTYIIPNKVMNAYFGRSEKAYKTIPEIIGGAIKNGLLIGSQKKAFNAIASVFTQITA